MKKVPASLFVLLLITFILPFVTVSCQGKDIATFTELQLATGTTIESPNLGTGAVKKEKIAPDVRAMGALGAVVVGLVVSLSKLKWRYMGVMVFSLVGLACNMLLKAEIDNQLISKGSGMFQASYGVGFYGSLVLFLATIAAGWYLNRQEVSNSQDQRVLSTSSVQ